MFPLDIEIWERYLEKYGGDYLGFDYDIKVGTGLPAGPGTPENYARMQDILSKYRIDAVGYKPERIEIIEIKPEASTVAIGQVITYIELYVRDLKPTRPVVGVIVTNRSLPDVSYLTAQKKIEYYVV